MWRAHRLSVCCLQIVLSIVERTSKGRGRMHAESTAVQHAEYSSVPGQTVMEKNYRITWDGREVNRHCGKAEGYKMETLKKLQFLARIKLAT